MLKFSKIEFSQTEITESVSNWLNGISASGYNAVIATRLALQPKEKKCICLRPKRCFRMLGTARLLCDT